MTGIAAGTARVRCGVSRSTLRKWLGRYRDAGKEGLRARSRIAALSTVQTGRSPNVRMTILRQRAWYKGMRAHLFSTMIGRRWQPTLAIR
ncbi:helix-turn-helix domain-containing protein [Burkholderia sp. WP9]|uniref:helix-turn-helix domain-containing protein n=1 Tax=Burkholderia sp. WP9 TaxID=1500263 RepID=UPI002570E46A|nr:helix-turn-helix domain-containing protein [Burkholderia sp. WP9]